MLITGAGYSVLQPKKKMQIDEASVDPNATNPIDAWGSSLLAAAIAAPSADNRLPFCWRRTDDGLALYRRSRAASCLPHQRWLDDLSLGAVSVNLEIRAAALGLTLSTPWSLFADNNTALVRVAYVENGKPSRRLNDAQIDARHTHRGLIFRAPNLSSVALAGLEASAAADRSARLHWLDAPALRRSAVRGVVKAETARFAHRLLHRELFEAIRFKAPASGLPVEGLAPPSLALNAVELWMFPLLAHWPVQRAGNWFGLHHMIGWRSAGLPCWLAPHLCAISVESGAVNPAFEAGRALQRVWLEASALNLAFQIFAAGPLYAQPDISPLPPAQQSDLARIWAQCCDGQTPAIAFRMGLAPPVAGRNARPAIAALRCRAEAPAQRASADL
jgi:hypothetical protein